MKWYDYIVIFFIADVASASIVTGNILGLTISAVIYFIYEDMRKNDNESD
jgi:hypothetical protein